MPSIISHAIIGYLIFGKPGIIYSILPDLIGMSYYFIPICIKNYNNISLKKLIKWGDIFPQSRMKKMDWFLYNISHSLIVWFTIYYITKDKAVYAAIFAILMDIFLHSNNIWVGPAFMYPLSEYRFNGIHWLSWRGLLITLTVIIILFLIPKDKIKEFIDMLP